MWIREHESAKFWLTVLTKLKGRGVRDILVVAVDNLTGFSEATASVFPKADIQKCIVHPIRNSLKYVARKDYAAVTTDLKPIYRADTEDGAKRAMDAFAETWGGRNTPWWCGGREHWTEWMTFFQYLPRVAENPLYDEAH